MIPHSQLGKTVARQISAFVERTTLNRGAPAVLETAKIHLLDGLATILGGASEVSAELLRRHYLKLASKTSASVLGTVVRLPIEHAALINGFQGHVLDYDDAQLTTLASRPMGQQAHPTAPVLAAALALAESRPTTGAQLLTAYVTGIEVACRLGDAIAPSHYLDGFHPTGTVGVFGAAAACARLLNLKGAAIRHTLGIAGTLSSGLRANRGTMAKGLNAGRAAESGVFAATLAADGFTASENIFDDPMGFFSALSQGRVDRDLLRFGNPFFFSAPGVALKLYPCAGVLHPALDLALKLRERHRIALSSIEQIKVTLNASAARPLVYDRPKNALQAKFSLNFAIAVAMVDGAAGLKQFSAEFVHNKDVQRLMRRVKLIPRAARKQPGRPGIDTEIDFAMKNGETYHGKARIARGHPGLPPSRGEIEDKFYQCTLNVLPARQSVQFLKNFWNLEHVENVAAWLRPLCLRRR